MKRIHLIFMALLAMTILTSFVDMKAKKEDKSIETLWEDYSKAENLDQVRKMADVLEVIKTKARENRASWDFYKANVQYVFVKTRQNWKLRDSLYAQMRRDIEGYDEPLLTYLVNRDYFYDDTLIEKVQMEASRLRKGHNHDVYTNRSMILNPAVAYSVRNDYEYVLWDLFGRQYNRVGSKRLDMLYQLLAEEVGGNYPQAGLAEYFYVICRDDAEDEAALKDLMDRYQGRALYLLPAWKLIEKDFRKNQSTGTQEYFIELKKRLDDYEYERKKYKGGIDGRIAQDYDLRFGYLADHLESKSVMMKIRDGKTDMALRNLDKVKVRVTKGDDVLFETLVENPRKSFYVFDTVAFSLPSLDDGDYRIRCYDGKEEIGQCHYPKFTLSVALRNDGSGKSLYVADYKTGEPLNEVDLKLYKGDRLVEDATGVALDGFTRLPANMLSAINKNNSSYYIVCTATGEDGKLRRSNDMYLSRSSSYGGSAQVDTRSLSRVMLDRAAFKPGETVKFKAVVYDVAPGGGLSVAQKGKKVTVKLRDSQGNELKTSDFALNDFGSIAGEFLLDDVRRNGLHSISVYEGTRSLGSMTFTVDEFVLPTFDVSFDEAEEPFLPGDTVVVKGCVRSYSGHSLASATVEAEVMYDDRLVKHEVLNLAPDGSFVLSFVDEETEESYASYNVEIKVTDLTGETMSFYSYQYIMRRPALRASLENWAEGSCVTDGEKSSSKMILSEDIARVSFAVSGSGSGDYAGLPLKYRLEKDGKKILESEAVTGEVAEVDFSSLDSGLYDIVAEISMKDARGKEMTAKTQCAIVKVRDTDETIGEDFENLFRVVEEDDIALQFGAGKGNVWAVVELFGDKGQLLKSDIVYVAAGQMKVLRYDYKKEYPDGLRLNVLYFRNSRCYTYNRMWKRPVQPNVIPLEILRFEDTALPRSACSVKLRVPSDCEVLASVFDLSTERIRSNAWREIKPPVQSVAYVDVDNTAGMNGSGYDVMMGDQFNLYNDGYVFDGSLLGEVVVGYGQPRRGLLRSKSANSTMDYVTVEEETMAAEAVPFQLAAQEVSVREDFASSLAFEPFLRPSADGTVSLDFMTADKLSSFVVSVFAHDRDMNNTVMRREMLVTLPVKVDVVQPQYLYAGDKYVLNASLSSTSELPVSGVARLEIYASDTYEGEPVMTAASDVTVPAGGSVPVSFEVEIPSGVQVVGLKVTFAGADVSDGVFVTVPVYPAEQVLEEAHSAVLLAGMSEEAILESLRKKFVNVSAAGAEYSSVTIMDMLREALPLVVEAGVKDAISLSEAMYVNLLAAGLREAEGQPVREYVDAAMEAAEKVLACANADGGFGWFEGMKSSPAVTAVVLERYAGLRDRRLLNVVSELHGEDALDAFDDAVTAAVKYIDSACFSDPDRPSWYGGISLWQYMEVRSMYVGVPFDKAAAVKAVGAKEYKEFKKAVKALLVPKKGERWADGAILSKVRMIRIINSLIGSSYGEEIADAWGLKMSSKLRKSMAVELASLKEYAVEHPAGGIYYPNAVLPMRGLLESEAYAHAMICDLFKDLSSDPELGEGLAEMADAVRVWIMLQKETQQWSSDPGFVEALASVYDGSDAVKDTKVIVLSKRYVKPFGQIKAAGNGFKVSVKYYREVASAGSEPKRVELVDGDALNLGEKIVAEYSVWSEENRSFVRLSVPRAACLRPEHQLSGWAGGWIRPFAYGIYNVAPYAYREVKADRTLYWIDVFPEENSKIEETMFVTQEGVFAAPVAEIESLYAPHYRANDSYTSPVVVE